MNSNNFFVAFCHNKDIHTPPEKQTTSINMYLDLCSLGCRCYFAADYAHSLNLHEYYSHNPVLAIQQSFNPHLVTVASDLTNLKL